MTFGPPKTYHPIKMKELCSFETSGYVTLVDTERLMSQNTRTLNIQAYPFLHIVLFINIYRIYTNEWCGFPLFTIETAPFFCVDPVFKPFSA
jgi:hypothetical protein